MKRIYIAGPFSGKTGYAVERNVRRAEDFILPIAEAGACAICPHTMTRTFDGTLTYGYWIAATLCMLDACDAILMTPDWRMSSGADGERARAITMGIPIFEADEPGALPTNLTEWLRGNS